MADDLRTDEATELRTDGVDVESEPTDVDEAGDEAKETRAEKTAKKLGVSPDELKEMKSGKKLDERLARIEEALDPIIQETATKKLKAEFESEGLNADFSEFQSAYQELIELGADPAKAKAKVMSDLRGQVETKAEDERADGRKKASLPPRTDVHNAVHQFPLVTKKAFESMFMDKGAVYYKEYCAYCEKHHGGKYWKD
jgi:hypothetical protein